MASGRKTLAIVDENIRLRSVLDVPVQAQPCANRRDAFFAVHVTLHPRACTSAAHEAAVQPSLSLACSAANAAAALTSDSNAAAAINTHHADL